MNIKMDVKSEMFEGESVRREKKSEIL